MKPSYVRFVIEERDEDSHENKGLFVAMESLVENNELYAWETAQEKAIYQWFTKNLNAPHVQSSTSNYYAKPKAISWFKDSAKEHIEKMRQYGQILEAHDYPIKQLVTDRLGKILYEDKFQIAAVPFGDTFG